MCLMPVRLATAFSTLRATSVSSCVGDAPSNAMLTVMMGNSMSGNCWMPNALKPPMPINVSSANSKIAGTGLRIDQADTFMGNGCQSKDWVNLK